MYQQRSILGNILTLIGGIFIFFIAIGIIGNLLWFAIKIILPIALIVWLVRELGSYRNNRYRRY